MGDSSPRNCNREPEEEDSLSSTADGTPKGSHSEVGAKPECRSQVSTPKEAAGEEPSPPSAFSTIEMLDVTELEKCLEALVRQNHRIVRKTADTSDSATENVKDESAEADSQSSKEESNKVCNLETSDQASIYHYVNAEHPLILTVPRDIDPICGGTFSSFESRQFFMADGCGDVDVMLIAYKGRKRVAAPTPEEFARLMQEMVSTIPGAEGNDQHAIIDASQRYTTLFNDAMGLVREDYYPSIDGSMEAVVELIGDVRTSAWNLAAFIFKRG